MSNPLKDLEVSSEELSSVGSQKLELREPKLRNRDYGS